MKLSDFREVCENVNIDDYLSLYNYVRDNMEHPEWLGTFSKDEVIDILGFGGKIWMYYDGNTPVCSIFYIPASNKSLRKYDISYDEEVTGSLGPVMVSKEYVGNGLQLEMMNMLDKYTNSIGKTHMFTKAHSDNIYSINNIIKNGYTKVMDYTNERGPCSVFVK